MTQMTDAEIVFTEWHNTGFVPEGWDVDVEEESEGGQPNGVGDIEPSDYREWYTDERETHHRAVLTVTVTGPWEKGPTASAAYYQRLSSDRLVRENREREDKILADAERIQAERRALKD